MHHFNIINIYNINMQCIMVSTTISDIRWDNICPRSSFYTIMFMPFGLLAHISLKLIWLPKLSILSVPDKVYSRNASCALNYISTFVFAHRSFVCIDDMHLKSGILYDVRYFVGLTMHTVGSSHWIFHICILSFNVDKYQLPVYTIVVYSMSNDLQCKVRGKYMSLFYWYYWNC
jgi:hypothetical protein